MKWLLKPLAELFGLFVEDGSLVIAMLLWVAAIGFGNSYLPIEPKWKAILFFAGLAGLFLENVTRAARKSDNE